MPENVAWMKRILSEQGITWRGADLPDDTVIAEHPLGARTDGLRRAADIGRIDLRAVLRPTGNPFLVARRHELDLADALTPVAPNLPPFAPNIGSRLSDNPPTKGLPPYAPSPLPEPLPQPPSGGAASSVDWRNRWGTNWITSIRDQGSCESCWAFAGTALLEAMMKIDCAYWARLSEGDLHDGVGSRCADGNNLGSVSDFLAAHGLADPGCWPYRQDNPVYAPSSDRDGRSVRMPAFSWVGDIAQQKEWIDTTGPLATWFDVWHDFDGYTSGYVYRRSSDPSNYERGGHFMLVVGYDDTQSAWICKNSWGNWGDHGYVLVGYGESGIDDYAKAGLTGINPDPWTKRRLSNGALYESGNGAMHRNLEVSGASGGRVTPHWREGGPPWTWNTSGPFGDDAAACPTLHGTTYNRNIECVYLTTGQRLHHWWRSGGGGSWNDGGVFGPSTCGGVPGFVQGDYGAPGNFEVVALVDGGQLQHLWRENGAPWTWHDGPRFGAGVAYSGATLVQSDYYGNGHGNLECVSVLGNGQMQHFWRDATTLAWHNDVTFGSGCASSPVMIQGQYGMHDESGPNGNFELCIAVDGAIQHWWRDNASGSMRWSNSATFGSDVLAVAGLCESSWGMNLEVIALRGDGQLQHYWRDGGGWHAGPVIGRA